MIGIEPDSGREKKEKLPDPAKGVTPNLERLRDFHRQLDARLNCVQDGLPLVGALL